MSDFVGFRSPPVIEIRYTFGGLFNPYDAQISRKNVDCVESYHQKYCAFRTNWMNAYLQEGPQRVNAYAGEWKRVSAGGINAYLQESRCWKMGRWWWWLGRILCSNAVSGANGCNGDWGRITVSSGVWFWGSVYTPCVFLLEISHTNDYLCIRWQLCANVYQCKREAATK